ncbi:MAG: hypothetical protein FJY07_01340 [Bacteroidetes bacterium]|nr:hypothetical protein [Bacteroidota bacterium]
MILPHRNIGHKDFHIVDYEAKTYVDSYDSMCLCGSKLLFGVDSKMKKQVRTGKENLQIRLKMDTQLT